MERLLIITWLFTPSLSVQDVMRTGNRLTRKRERWVFKLTSMSFTLQWHIRWRLAQLNDLSSLRFRYLALPLIWRPLNTLRLLDRCASHLQHLRKLSPLYFPSSFGTNGHFSTTDIVVTSCWLRSSLFWKDTRHRLVVTQWRFGQYIGYIFKGQIVNSSNPFPFGTELTGCSETSVINHHPPPRNIPERRPQLYLSGSL